MGRWLGCFVGRVLVRSLLDRGLVVGIGRRRRFARWRLEILVCRIICRGLRL